MSASTTMEGYLHKKGHTLPTMQRRYCVLKGTMLAYYTNADEYARMLTPRNVLEVIGVNEISDTGGTRSGVLLSPSKRKHAFEIEYLGGTTYQCHADSREEKHQWLAALQHALDEPNRIVQDEIEDAQRHLQDEAEKEDHAMAMATDAVHAAQRYTDDAVAVDAAIKNCKSERITLDEQVQHALILLEEAKKKSLQTKHALHHARAKAHDMALTLDNDDGGQDDDDGDDASLSSAMTAAAVSADDVADRIARLAAQLEVDQTHEATQAQLVGSLEQRILRNAQQLDEFQQKAKKCAEESRKLRESAASSLQSAQSAKHLSRLRVSSWTASSSHLDPLAEGYLLCKHPYKPSMHRRYCVLYGNTLCWYKDVDDYTQHVHLPSGVVHVSAVTEWTGKVGGMKTFPFAFAVTTVEGKTMYCSAPMKQSAVTWETALHIGLTMPALSPHRAMQAKARRDSFDLLSGPALAPTGPMKRRASLAHVAAPEAFSQEERKKEENASPVILEGYLVKKSALFPVMKKKYCVLHGLKLGIFESHEQYAAQKADDKPHGDHEEVLVCGVSEWDGHGTLLQYHHGFQIHTVQHHMIQCSGANENEKNKWIRGIHEAILKYKDQLLTTPTKREDEALDQARASILKAVLPGDATSSGASTSAARFRVMIQQFYVEHHPTKAHDVPVLVEKYALRERALVTHLDKIHGTTLSTQPDMLLLLDELEKPNVAFTSSTSPKGRRRADSGVHSGLQEFGKMTGYLTWTFDDEKTPPSAALSFSVLSVDKLLKYSSETMYDTEPYNPVEAIQLVSVSELEGMSFAVTYRPTESSSSSASRPSSPEKTAPRPAPAVTVSAQQLKLIATSLEQKTLWMAKIRSGLGFAAASHATSPAKKQAASPQRSSGGQAELEKTGGTEEATFRSQLISYYRIHNPRRIAEVDTLLHYFSGREKQLLVDLDATYGSSTCTDPAFLAVLPSSPASQQGDDDNKEAAATVVDIHFESYVQVKHPVLGVGFRKCYCVLHNTKWSCYDNSRDAHASHTKNSITAPLMSDTFVNLHHLSAKLHEMRVISIEGEIHGAILFRADVEPLCHDWTHSLRQAADLHQQLTVPAVPPDGANGEATIQSWRQDLEAKLVQFYSIHNPDKALEVARLLESFQGRERALLLEIDRIYHTQIAQDPAFLALLPPPESDLLRGTGDDATENSDGILMEGYLVKRGHLVPCMRKRYCVLVKNVLTYYLTHEDSRQANTQPLGSFRVEIVSDWHGKTTTQVYEHGMELETHDGKTFFCAAFSSDEKTQWMRAFHHGIAVVRAEEQHAVETPVGDAEPESEDSRAKRALFRDRLVEYYETHNPRKIADLDLLLACYKGRELAMLEAMDVAYSTQLLQDESLLTLLPPLNAHTLALRKLEYDGPLARAAGGNTDAAWKRAQPVYVAQKGLTLTFYASREGFKTGAAALTSAADRAVTVLAVKSIDKSSLCRFAIETTDHLWMYFQAANVLEKAHWLELFHAALDAMLASTILEEEKMFLQHHSGDSGGAVSPNGCVLLKGFLMIRMDFMQSLEDYQQQVELVSSGSLLVASPKAKAAPSEPSSSLMKECFVVLQKQNELVLYPDDDKSHAIATLTALSTRAWKAVGGLSPTSSSSSTVGKFPFQIVTQEQIVLSCGAATDLERAKWIQQVRSGAQQAAAIEMLQEQLNDVGATAGTASSSTDEAFVVQGNERDRFGSVSDPMSGQRRGYLFYRPFTGSKQRTQDEKEGFFVVDARGGFQMYEDESAFLRRERPQLEAQAIELEADPIVDQEREKTGGQAYLSKIFGGTSKQPSGGGGHQQQRQLAFHVEFMVVSRSTETETRPQQPHQWMAFFPASQDEKTAWVDEIEKGINLCKGEQLLEDEKQVLDIETTIQQTSGPEEEEEEEEEDHLDHAAFVCPKSAMEGELTPWRDNEAHTKAHAHAGGLFFAILQGCRLQGFPSRDVALANAGSSSSSSNGSVFVPSPDLEIASLADWTPPPPQTTHGVVGTQDPRDNLGFQVEASQAAAVGSGSTGGGASVPTRFFFTAQSAEAKRQWVHAIQHELNFALAEKYLDEDAKEFIRQAAIHVQASSSALQEPSSSSSGAAAVVMPVRLEGYVRVRHQFVGSIWRERFAVAVGTLLWLFKDGSDAVEDDWQHRAMETHELLSAQPWQPTSTATRGLGLGHGHTQGSQQQYHHGVRLENVEGAMVELTFASREECDHWLSTTQQAIDYVASSQLEKGNGNDGDARFISRDPALPFVPGAAMEGFLKVRDKRQRSTTTLMWRLPGRNEGWKTRYAVLIGTQWLLYETQEQALALHGHNQQQDADYHGIPQGDVLPQAVLDVMLAEPWRKAASEKEGKEDTEMETHGFLVVANRASTTGGATCSSPPRGRASCAAAVGDVIECQAHTSLERKRWLNAMEDQIASIEKEQQLVKQALQHHKDKETAQQKVKSKVATLREDANRQSAFVEDILEKFGAMSTSSSQGSEDSEESEEDSSSSSEEEEAERKTNGKRRPTVGITITTSRSPLLGAVHSPENSPMYHRRPSTANDPTQGRSASQFGVFFDGEDDCIRPGSPSKDSKPTTSPWWSFQAVFSCCFDRPPPASTATSASMAMMMAPLKNSKYVYEYYHEGRATTMCIDDDDW